MKRQLFVLAPVLLAAGCAPAKDFTVEVERPASAVLSQLAALDGSLVGMLGLEPFKLVKDTEAGTLHFTIPAKDGYSDGELYFYVNDASGKSRIDVALELPAVRWGNKELDDDKAADLLQNEFETWARGGGSSAGQIQAALVGFTIAAQDVTLLESGGMRMAGGMATMMGGGSGGGWGDEPDRGSVTEEPEFGQPMNSTGGSSARGSSSASERYASGSAYDRYSDSDEESEEEDAGGGWGTPS